jgi:16S rRNA (guanine1516-N2)-methyltransferase
MLQKASELAKNLRVPFSDAPAAEAMALVFTDERLELRMNLDDSQPSTSTVLFIDFLGGKAGYRLASNCTINQPLARAVGIKSGFRPSVFDATAGMGGDAFVLASLGCTVTMGERSPVIAALLQDALDRAMADPKTARIVGDRLSLVVGDARQIMDEMVEPPYAIYMDPMYPHRRKSALNSKEMRMLRLIAGDDDDSPSLLEHALEAAGNRVVVKRPKGAPCISNRLPTHEIVMKNSRFDVYLSHHL